MGALPHLRGEGARPSALAALVVRSCSLAADRRCSSAIDARLLKIQRLVDHLARALQPQTRWFANVVRCLSRALRKRRERNLHLRLTQSVIQSIAHNAPALLVANEAHEILFATPNARRWLRKFFRMAECEKVLPPRVCRWLAAETAAAVDTLKAQRGRSFLYLRKYAPQPAECIALLLELVDDRETLPGSGALSRRQQDVLRWIASGKSNKAIAAILNIAPKTVGKHVENLFRKLGVNSRVAAANAYAASFGAQH